MHKLATMCATTLAICLYAAPGHAQATRTWVSGVGNDIDPCSRTAPCKTFAGALSKTAANGEINCVDNGAFGAVTINKAITISCDTNEAGVLATLGSNGVTVIAGASDVVTLIGLDINGVGTGNIGIRFLSGAALHVLKTKVYGFRASSTGNGIVFAPSATSELFVSDSFISANGTSTTTGGIVIEPTGSGVARVSINRNQIENNTVGVRVGGSASTGGIRVLLRDNMIVGNTNNGVLSSASTAVTTVFLERNSVFGNSTGIQSDGANSFMQINGNTITGNIGVGMSPTAGGQLQSYVNNFVNLNSGGDGVTAGVNLIPK